MREHSDPKEEGGKEKEMMLEVLDAELGRMGLKLKTKEVQMTEQEMTEEERRGTV